MRADSNFNSEGGLNEEIPKYNSEKHQAKQIIVILFKSMFRKEEKISFAALKLLDLFLEKNIPEINDELYLKSI